MGWGSILKVEWGSLAQTGPAPLESSVILGSLTRYHRTLEFLGDRFEAN